MTLDNPFRNKLTGRETTFTAGSRSLLDTAVPCPWQHIRVDRRFVPAYENPELISEAHVFGVKVNAEPSVTEWRSNGSWNKHEFQQGELGIHPAGLVDKMRSATFRVTEFAHLDHAAVAQTCAGFELPSEFEYKTVLPVRDELLSGAVKALVTEAENGYVSGELYGDAIAASLAAHLLFRYAERKAVQEPRGGLPKTTLALVLAYMEEHAEERVRLNDLAALAHLSPYHFSRLFKNSTGQSPYQYLMRCRVKLARQLIKKGDMTLREVSRAAGFYDSSHFARVFKRVTGVKAAEVFKHFEEE